MTKSVELIVDVVSPNLYMLFGPLREAVERQGAELHVTPIFLAGLHKLTGNAPPMQRDAGVRGKNEYAMLEIRRFLKTHALDRFRVNSAFPFNTVTVQRMLCVAVEDGRGVELADLLLRLIWEENRDLSQDDVILESLAGTQFDGPSLLERARRDANKQRLVDRTQAAADRGVFGVPTVFVGDEMFFGKERLAQIEKELAG